MSLITQGLLSLPGQINLSCPDQDGSEEKKVEVAKKGYVELFGKALSGGTIILKKPDETSTSEGIGFGGLIYSAKDDKSGQDTYWHIFRARKSYFLKSTGVMSWLTDKSGKVLSRDSASDGDQDWIASELIVLSKLISGKWKIPAGMNVNDFRAAIQKDLNAFWKAHVKSSNGKLLFLASDGSWAKRGDGREIYYPSYPDPAFLRMFAEFDKAHDWKKLANDVQTLNQEILKNHKKFGAVGQNPMPAKVFASVSADGSFRVENYYTISKKEGVKTADLKDNELDSIRFFLRMGRAAIIKQDQQATKMLTQIIAIAKITDPSSAHILAGEPGAPSKWGYNNTLARAAYGLAALGAGDKVKANLFFCTVLKDHKGKFFGEWDGAKKYYYDQSLILQILDLTPLK